MGRVINISNENRGSSGDFKPIPHGTKVIATVFRIEEVAVKGGQNAGKPQLEVDWKVQGGDHNGREIRFDYIPLYDGKSAWKLDTFAEAVGWNKDANGNVELPDNLQSTLGTPAEIRVTEKTPDAQNRIFNGVGGYAKASGSAANEAASSSSATPSWSSLNGS